MDREKYYEQILNAVDTGILVVDCHDNILQHNQAALRLLNTDVLTHMNQVKGKLKDEHLAKHETQAMLKDKHVRIIALSDVSHELSNQEVDSWIKLIRVLTHEIMNTITPVTSLSETLLTRVTEDKDLKQGLETIHKQEQNCWLSSTTIAVSPMFPSLSLLSSMWNHSWKEWRCSATTK